MTNLNSKVTILLYDNYKKKLYNLWWTKEEDQNEDSESGPQCQATIQEVVLLHDLHKQVYWLKTQAQIW